MCWTATTCGGTLTLPADTSASRGSVVSDTQTIYDNAAAGTVTRGDVTTTRTAIGYTSSTDLANVTWRTTATNSYDPLGRVTSTTDPNAPGGATTTTTAYTPAGAGPLTQEVATQTSTGWSTTTSYAPAWGEVTGEVDANGNTTMVVYDALGRVSQVWQPNRPKASNPIPSAAYAYTLSTSAPNVIASTTINDSGGTLTGYALIDGLGQQVQTQTPSEGGGIVVTDTGYDASGHTIMTTAPYYATGTPSGTHLTPATSVPSQTETIYDGAGRVTASVLVSNAAEDAAPTGTTEKWRTTTAYSGVDRTDVTPPSGGTPTSTFTDARGDTTRLVQYLGPIASSPKTETTTYGYDAAKEMTAMTNPAGSAWSWTFNVLGQQVTAKDPDSGTTTSTYTADGQQAAVTDNAGSTITYSYDNLGRKTAEYQGSSSGVELASWSYDSAPGGKGQPASSTSYVGGTAGQPGSGDAYIESVGGYTPLGAPTATAITLPVGALAGNTSPLTYTTSYSYAAAGGALIQNDPAMGGLPAERLGVGYDSYGMQAGLSSAAGGYVSGVTYTHLGQVGQVTQNDNTENWRTNTWGLFCCFRA